MSKSNICLQKPTLNTEYRNQPRTNVHLHLPIVFDCHEVIIKCGQKVAHIENNGLGRWLNANLNGQFVIAIWRIAPKVLQYDIMSLGFQRWATSVLSRSRNYTFCHSQCFLMGNCCPVFGNSQGRVTYNYGMRLRSYTKKVRGNSEKSYLFKRIWKAQYTSTDEGNKDVGKYFNRVSGSRPPGRPSHRHDREPVDRAPVADPPTPTTGGDDSVWLGILFIWGHVRLSLIPLNYPSLFRS